MKGFACELCPRRCMRRPGFCGAGDGPRLFRWGPHFGEEPPLAAGGGSGCIFFSRCTMKCVYCQNSPWSWRGEGTDRTVGELAGVMRDLATKDGCSNWNLVSPTPYLPYIREAAGILASERVRLPFVWNSSGYERVETLEEYRDLCDVALFDLRYSSDETAMRLSQAPQYVRHARAAVKWAHENCPGAPGGVPGLIVRILVLPGHSAEAVESLRWLAGEVSNEVHVSIMAQYTPAYQALELPPLDRKVNRGEYEEVAEAAEELGFANGWTQDFSAADPKLAFLGENMPAGAGAIGES